MWPFNKGQGNEAAPPEGNDYNPPSATASSDPSQPSSSSVVNDTIEAAKNGVGVAENYIENVGNNVNAAVGSIGSKIQNVPTVFGDVSAATMSENLQSWVSSDNLVSKILFVVIMLVVFFFLLRMTLILIFFLVPSWNSPYLVSGVLEGTKSVEIRQDPRSGESNIISRSKNQMSGIEFSWCVWLQITEFNFDSINSENTAEFAVFCKGVPQTQAAPFLKVGLQKMVSGTETSYTGANTETLGVTQAYLILEMDTYDSSEDDGNREQTSIQRIKITNIPMKKWVHVCIRLQNTALDVYINGNATRRVILPAVPKQNFGNLFVFPKETNTNGKDFPGFLADLIYYPYALNTYRLNALVETGPNTQPSVMSSTSLTVSTKADYLASTWYTTQRQ